MENANPNVGSTCPVVFLKLTRYHNTWGKMVSLRISQRILLHWQEKIWHSPRTLKECTTGLGPLLSPSPQWAKTLRFSLTIKYCRINCKTDERQTSQCETHQTPPFCTLNIWGGGLISKVTAPYIIASCLNTAFTSACEKHGLHRILILLEGTFGLPFHYEEEELSFMAKHHLPAPHFQQGILYRVHQEKQLSIDMKAWKCGEEKYCILNYLNSRVSWNASF